MIDGIGIDSIELKCLVVSRGVKVDKNVYAAYSKTHRLSTNPLACNCFTLSDGTYVQLTDMGFHLQYLTGILSWNNLKLLKYASELGTPFSVKLADGKAALFYGGEQLDFITFPPKNDFYSQKTSSSLPFMGNAVLQGCDWVAFQCLWPCQYAAAGQQCQFCFSGGETQTLAAKNKPLPPPMEPRDLREIVEYAVKYAGVNSVQITGGSTFSGEAEARHIIAYLSALLDIDGLKNGPGEILLYITPPADLTLIDEYFSLGAGRIACSLEVWDEEIAAEVTPGKMRFTSRQRHLDALERTVQKYGAGKAFSNFIIGIEGIETLKEGVIYLAERGIIPAASIWMPMGRPVRGSMKAPDLDYYRRVKEMFAEAYSRYKLEPAGNCGLNVCMERDIWRYSKGLP